MNKIYYPYPCNDGKHKYYIITILSETTSNTIISRNNIFKI